jgi:inhibitor of cysteine peptidase
VIETMKMTKIILTLMIFTGILLSACQAVIGPDDPTEVPPVTEPAEPKYEYDQRATVEFVEVILLESFPLQAQAIVSGTLPDGCSELYEISVEQNGLRFNLTLTTRHLTGDVACTEALVPFEETVDLDIHGLEAGTYTVIAQDKQATFTLDVNNVISGEGEDTKYSYGSQATVETMNINIMESFPVQVSVDLSGYLPDGCTTIYEISAQREEQTFTIDIVTRKPVDVACTMAIVPFEETISLDVEGLPAGEYTVQYGDMYETFTLEQDN